ncbi:hypothetical protein [Acinetobacter proteolyticus]|uniref:Uncharacterized protein n=1 Tax=Acinetobacter proteolyticus TaxID=1776741 RepID=A0A2N0WI69_9GAMM|nr:hypothetical protein [Acinetobacter proteolyticus]PKF35497.1 hypothetical protein CW311_04200 [Acinetobacter proteolyticus]
MMDDTNLVGFCYKEGWYQTNDFILDKLAELKNEDLSYDDCLAACGYGETPEHDFSRNPESPYFIKVFSTLHTNYPMYLVQMSITEEMHTDNFVCKDGLSLLDLLSKLAPIVSLKLNCENPFQVLHLQQAKPQKKVNKQP